MELTKEEKKFMIDVLRTLIYKLNEIELMIKKNINNSINLITDFLLEQSSLEINN